MVEYEIRMAGVVPEALLLEMNGVRVTFQPGHTVLRGPLPDRTAVHEVIERLQGLGLELIEMRRLTEPVVLNISLLGATR